MKSRIIPEPWPPSALGPRDRKRHEPPKSIDGVAVRVSRGAELDVKGETWVTLVPKDDEDERLWEFSVTTGRVIRTR